MGGSSFDDEWQLTPKTNDARTVVLVGRTGNGKSATGNSILGRKAFNSRSSSSGVTSSCELQSSVLEDGSRINVIDTPGLFDFSDGGSEFIGKEIVKCIDLAKDGIHAVLVVFSVRTRFSQEDEAALRSLQILFGSKIVNYVIIVFTGGDGLEDEGDTLDEYLGRECPEPLRKIIALCENRIVLFNNKTLDERKKVAQFQQFSFLLNMVVTRNDGKPYTDKLFTDLKKGAIKLRDQTLEVDALTGYSKGEIDDLKEKMHKTYEKQLNRITEMVESKLRETTTMLEEKALKAQMESNEEISKLRESLEKARRETDELRKGAESGKCGITEMVESKLRETTTMLEKQLSEEQAARLREEEKALKAQMESKEEISKLRESLEKARRETDELRKGAESGKCGITEMVESKLRETTTMLEKQLSEEQAARLREEEKALKAQMESNEEISKLRESLEKARRDTEELRKSAESGKCAIL